MGKRKILLEKRRRCDLPETKKANLTCFDVTRRRRRRQCEE